MYYEYATKDAKVTAAPTDKKAFRKDTDWSKMSNDELIFATNLLSSHNSPFEVDVANEISKRIDQGKWIELDSPVPAMADLPWFFYIWPFRLLWSQRPR
jgi:hypothetical protein